MAVVGFGNLYDQGPLGTPDGRKGYQHFFSVNREFDGSGFAGGYMVNRFVISAVLLSYGAPGLDQGLFRMTCDNSLTVGHICHTVSAQIDAADHIVECVVFVDTCHIHDCFTVFFYRHSHGDTQLILKDCGRIRSQIICFTQKCKKTVFQMFRCTINSLDQLSVQIIQGDGVQLVDFCRFRQDFLSVCLSLRNVKGRLFGVMICSIVIRRFLRIVAV